MENKIQEALNELESLYLMHQKTGIRLHEESHGKVYPMDALTYAVLNRSLHQLSGFELLMEKDNYMCCLPMLRMQLDTLLRYYAFRLVSDPHDFANKIINGERIDQLIDKENNYMKDWYLVKKASKDNKWVKRVYDVCSSYVHLSGSHVYSFLDGSPLIDDGKRELTITTSDEHIPVKTKLEAIIAIKHITEGIIKCALLWITKERNKYDETELIKRYKGID